MVPPAGRPTRSERRLRRLAVAMTLLLLAQFVLGMVVNLYVTIPVSGNVTGRAAVFLYAHMVLGTALLVVALVLAGLAVAARRRLWLVSSAIGVAGIALAISGGLTFLIDGGHPGDSFLMAVGFIIAITSYATAAHRSR
jgi:membrane-bound ClpP family serine protease